MIEEIKKDIENKFKNHPKRLKHVYGVYDTALELGKQFNLNPEKLGIAALLHDTTKYLSNEETVNIIKKHYKNSEEILSQFSEKLLHAFTAVVYAKERYHIKDIDILNSIKYHTIGKENMNLYEKIIFISDYIEPNRMYESCVKVREIAFDDLDKAVYQAIKYYIIHHESKGYTIPNQAYLAYDFYKRLEEDHGKN